MIYADVVPLPILLLANINVTYESLNCIMARSVLISDRLLPWRLFVLHSPLASETATNVWIQRYNELMNIYSILT